MQSAVRGFHHVLSPQVKRSLVGRGKHQHGCPGIAVLALVDRQLKTAERPRRDVLTERGAAIKALNAAIGARKVDLVFVFGIDGNVTALAAAGQKPVARIHMSVIGTAVHRNRTAVLLCSIYSVRKTVVGGDVIKLSGGLVVPRCPGLATVEADGRALIDTQGEMRRVLRVYPDLVVVIATGRTAHNFDGSAAIV